ncbi:MAG: hemerythrin family protein [Planctomycetes bacterium]|nr:hemerythrin family protein [Planctomycetota bacterium]
MEWNDKLVLGVGPMDSEHQGLVEAMNHVYELDQANAGKAAVDAALQKLAALTTKHFADEEAHMEKIGYPDLRTHQVVHKNMLQKFTELFTAFKAGSGSVDKAFYDFLKFWLKSHIMGIDRKYADHKSPAGV